LKRPESPCTDDASLVEECAARAEALLRFNLTPHGIMAASHSSAAQKRGYAMIFARDAAICALTMLRSNDPALVRGALASIDTLAAHQAENGQIPKYVDPGRNEADFWYLGCIDATLWWLIAAALARELDPRAADPQRWPVATRKAIDWLRCQEHPKFFLLQQNEASDWADIMPRSGFVLYTNSLWYRVKQLYGLAHAEETKHHFNHLFHPFSGDLPEYRRARLLVHYVQRKARNREVYLSFVNFSFFGDEGDVFGNLLAVLCGLSSEATAQQIVHALERGGICDPLPVRVTCTPIPQDHLLWRPYMNRHQQNLEHQYHNGGIWPFVGGFWVMTLVRLGKHDQARRALADLAHANSLDNWRFTEWFHGRIAKPMGMAGQSWNAATFLLAREAVLLGQVASLCTPASC
jgi:glycosyl hydrolase family 100 (putative invertase)